MEKAYMTPLVATEVIDVESMIATSITEVGGNAGIDMGEGDAPAEADAKGRNPHGFEADIEAEPQYGDLWQ